LAGEVDEAGFIGDAQDGAADFGMVVGHDWYDERNDRQFYQ
jgi:hypothetical protein